MLQHTCIILHHIRHRHQPAEKKNNGRQHPIHQYTVYNEWRPRLRDHNLINCTNPMTMIFPYLSPKAAKGQLPSVWLVQEAGQCLKSFRDLGLCFWIYVKCLPRLKANKPHSGYICIHITGCSFRGGRAESKHVLLGQVFTKSMHTNRRLIWNCTDSASSFSLHLGPSIKRRIGAGNHRKWKSMKIPFWIVLDATICQASEGSRPSQRERQIPKPGHLLPGSSLELWNLKSFHGKVGKKWERNGKDQRTSTLKCPRILFGTDLNVMSWIYNSQSLLARPALVLDWSCGALHRLCIDRSRLLHRSGNAQSISNLREILHENGQLPANDTNCQLKHASCNIMQHHATSCNKWWMGCILP